MPKPKTIMALAKVIIAAAWADGEMSHEEVNSLKDLLFAMPEMTARDWAKLEIYMHSPVTESDRAGLVADLKAALSNPREKALAISKLEEMVSADEVVTEQERAVVEEIKDVIQEVDVSIFGRVGRLLRGPVNRRTRAVDQSHTRELFLDDFIKNRIYYDVRRHLSKEQGDLDIPESEIRKLSLAGGLMARVAYVDREVSEQEFDRMLAAMQQGWDISRDAAALVADIAVDQISKDLDFYRLTRQFFERTNENERLRFLDVLFAVADADGRVSHEEIEEIRIISKMLKLTHRQFIQAKLKIPRERRAT
ncbi:MAG TPA: TerB family tellurite resistance protein [Anaerolineales bacterium]